MFNGTVAEEPEAGLRGNSGGPLLAQCWLEAAGFFEPWDWPKKELTVLLGREDAREKDPTAALLTGFLATGWVAGHSDSSSWSVSGCGSAQPLKVDKIKRTRVCIKVKTALL